MLVVKRESRCDIRKYLFHEVVSKMRIRHDNLLGYLVSVFLKPRTRSDFNGTNQGFQLGRFSKSC